MNNTLRLTVFLACLGIAALLFADDEKDSRQITLADGETKVTLEAPLPTGFPVPGALGKVIIKKYPAHRAVWCKGDQGFWPLWAHLDRKKIARTSPMIMRLNRKNPLDLEHGLQIIGQAFIYPANDQGELGKDGTLIVTDTSAQTVMSYALNGPLRWENLNEAIQAIRKTLAATDCDWQQSGTPRLLGYHTPRITQTDRWYEVQFPVQAKPEPESESNK